MCPAKIERKKSPANVGFCPAKKKFRLASMTEGHN